jgi:L-ascorbate metabolism protein UlaG (beta-lactamase superfamily)
VTKRVVSNKNLKTVKPDWQGTPIDENGRFVNHEFPFSHDFFKLLKWQFGRNPQAVEKQNDKERIEVLDPKKFLDSESDGILWLGHASFFIRLNGKCLLLDPVFGNPQFLKRFVNVESPLEKLTRIDAILISHDHRDHADDATIRQLTRKFQNAKLLAGLGMDDILNSWKTPSNELTTAGWYQEFAAFDDLKITFVPVRHWSRRSLTDTNKRLWGGFVIHNDKTTIYFSGDSGYGGHFKDLAELFPKIDYFIVGIGAYNPRFVMKEIHQNPEEALQGFVESGAEYLIPMHYGTFDLTNEPPNEPLKLLNQKASESGLSDKIRALKINEAINF